MPQELRPVVVEEGIHMKYAIIDLGTNSVRFDIHEVLESGKRRRLYRNKEMVRLGEGVFENAELREDAIERTLETLRAFLKKAKDLKVDEVIAVATSALRDAQNRDVFLERTQKECGLKVQVISGREEASLILDGIRNNEGLAKNHFAFMDIGGGSTEMGVSMAGETHFLESYQLGSARLQQLFLLEGPSEAKIKEMRDFIKTDLYQKKGDLYFPKLDFALGASGTIKALAKMMRKESGGRKVSRKRLKPLIEKMIKMDREERLKIPGLEEKRVDLIIPGAVLVDECMEFFDVRRVFHTRYALRDGLFAKALSLVRRRDS